MELRLWHWVLALALALLLHLLPFLWLGGGSGGEGQGRPFEGLSVVLQPLPDAALVSESVVDDTAQQSATTAAPSAPDVSSPEAVVVTTPDQTIATIAGESGAVVVSDIPLQPLAGGLDSAPPSTTLEAVPLLNEIESLPLVQVETRAGLDTVGALQASDTATPVTTPTPVEALPSDPGSVEQTVDQGPLLGSDQPLARVSNPIAPTLREVRETPPGGMPSPDVVEVSEVTVGEQGETLPLEAAPVATTSVPASSSPVAVAAPSLDQAGEEAAAESIDAGDGSETLVIEPTPPPLAMAVPPPPGGNTLAPTVSVRSEAILPAGPVPGESAVMVPQDEATTATPPPVDATEVGPEAEQVAEEVTLPDEQAPPLPAVEMQSRPSPARSWADMVPGRLAARLPAGGPSGQGEIPERGDVPGLVVDGALSGGEATARGRYLASVQSWLARHKHYPHQARQAGLEGEARLYLTLNRFGEIQTYEFLQRTGHPLLDRAVEALLKQAAPLPSMPGFLADDQLSMVVSIAYRLDE